MQTELAQIVSLTSYGNEFLKTDEATKNFFLDNTVFQHCNSVDFRELKKTIFFSKTIEKVIADNPIDWFKILRKEGCHRLRLFYKAAGKNKFGPEYNLAGFVGGAGAWLIETNFGNYSHYWQKRWQATDKEAVDNKIWSVNYLRIGKNSSPINQQVDVRKTKNEFAEIIQKLIDFCIQQDLKDWLETFEKAASALSHPYPNELYYHNNLIVEKNYSVPAQQLLFAASIAWVFGGMGWWNDMDFSDKDVQGEYLELSQQLYEQLLLAIIAVTNSF